MVGAQDLIEEEDGKNQLSDSDELQETLKHLKTNNNAGGRQGKGKRKIYSNNNHRKEKIIENEEEKDVNNEAKVISPNVICESCKIMELPKEGRMSVWKRIVILLGFVTIMYYIFSGGNLFTAIYNKLTFQQPAPELPVYQQWFNKLISGFRKS